MNSTYDVRASVVIYGNVESVTLQLISTLQKQVDLVVVVDNSPTQLSSHNQSILPKSSKILYQSLSHNPGYGAGHNFALQQTTDSKNTVHFIMNPDVEIHDCFVNELLPYFENPSVGVVMPFVVFPDGKAQQLARRVPKPRDVIRRIMKPYFRLPDGSYELGDLDWTQSNQVPIVSGCCLAIRGSIVKHVGGFDERFFMYFEDYDLSRRAASFCTVVAARTPTIIHHHGNASRQSAKMALIHLRSAARYFNKWGWFKDPERDRLNSQIGPYQINNGETNA